VTGQRSSQLNYDPKLTQSAKLKAQKRKVTFLLTLRFELSAFPTFFLVGGTGLEPVTAGV
jgi:hypothetical protein